MMGSRCLGLLQHWRRDAKKPLFQRARWFCLAWLVVVAIALQPIVAISQDEAPPQSEDVPPISESIAQGLTTGIPAILQLGGKQPYEERFLSTRFRKRSLSGVWGNLAFAPVSLDGYIAFVLAAPLPTESQIEELRIAPAHQRVNAVEERLNSVLRVADPNTLEVRAETLGNQVVLRASDRQRLRDFLLLTLTEYDEELYEIPVAEMGPAAARGIKRTILRALKEREPQALRQKAVVALQMFLVVCIASILLQAIQKWFKHRWQALNASQSNPHTRSTPNTEVGIKAAAEIDDPVIDDPANLPGPASLRPLSRKRLQRFLGLNLLARQLLYSIQLVIWLLGISYILQQFPQARQVGIWLVDIPLILFGIVLSVRLVSKISQLLIHQFVNQWVEERSIPGKVPDRKVLRAPTYLAAFKGAAVVFAWTSGIILGLHIFDVPIAPVLAGAGIVSVAISFGSQNVIKDIVNGAIVLLTDPYAVGDWVVIGDARGLVEGLSLLYVQVRNSDGELISIRHGAIEIIRNSSKEWARLDLSVEVDYATDVDRALTVIKSVAMQLCRDLEWRNLVLEEPKLLGVERLASSGILIRLWIKTLPMKQWQVGRELRRRLKQQFDTEGISIGIPQQSLQITEADNQPVAKPNEGQVSDDVRLANADSKQ